MCEVCCMWCDVCGVIYVMCAVRCGWCDVCGVMCVVQCM